MSRGRGREWAFRGVALSLPLVALLLLELLLRTFADPADPYVHLRGRTSIIEEVEDAAGARFVRVAHPEAYAARNTRFPVEKPAGARRIFFLGGSASAGWPHPPGQTYSAYLEAALRKAHPAHRFELSNLGAHAHASYRVRMILDDVIGYAPDLVVIYSGNNDFLERRSYGIDSPLRRRVEAWARSLRVVLWLGRRVGEFGGASLDGSSVRGGSDELVWSFVQRTSQALRRDPAQFARVVEHYEYSIEAMVQRAEEAGVPVALLTVPVNLSDWRPNAASQALEGEERLECEAALARGRTALEAGKTAEALAAFAAAIALAPENADAHYWHGRALLANGDAEGARRAFQRAVDTDGNPFRAISAFNRTLREIAARHPHVALADAERAFARAAEGGTPGFDLFLDYVHPTTRGNRVLAETVFQTIERNDLLGLGRSARGIDFGVGTGSGTGGYEDDRDLRMQAILLWVFGMNRQDETLVRRARRLRDQLDAAPELLRTDERERLLEFIAEVETCIAPHQELEHRRRSGDPVAEAEAEAVASRTAGFLARYYGSGQRPFADDRL
jgi:tetratricopeptide (TPR) repeat protein